MDQIACGKKCSDVVRRKTVIRFARTVLTVFLFLGAYPNFVMCQEVIRDKNNRIVRKIDKDGTVRDSRNQIVGKVSNGEVRDKNNRVVRKIDKDGTVRDSRNKIVGKVGNGEVRDKNNRVVRKIDKDGTVRDSRNQIVGKVAGDSKNKTDAKKQKK